MVYNFIISVGQICSFVLLCIVLSAVVTGTNTRLCVAYPGLYLFVVVQVILLSLLVIMAFESIITLFVRNVSFWFMHCEALAWIGLAEEKQWPCPSLQAGGG